MKLMSVAAMSAAVITGLAGAGVAYEIAAGDDSSTSSSSVADTSAGQAGQAGRDRAKARFAPCKKPAVLEKGACVTDVVRTVVLSGARLGAPARQSGSDDGPSHDAFDDHGDDGPRHDAFDDHGGDDADDDHDEAFDDHGDDDEVEDGDDHSGPGDSDSEDSEDHSGHGGGDDD